ncbi:MAG: hypothetical protein POG24_08810 [Acidocella sp.]|nr:hypothetical protein [Acidocella sp.]
MNIAILAQTGKIAQKFVAYGVAIKGAIISNTDDEKARFAATGQIIGKGADGFGKFVSFITRLRKFDAIGLMLFNQCKKFWFSHAVSALWKGWAAKFIAYFQVLRITADPCASGQIWTLTCRVAPISMIRPTTPPASLAGRTRDAVYHQFAVTHSAIWHRWPPYLQIPLYIQYQIFRRALWRNLGKKP